MTDDRDFRAYQDSARRHIDTADRVELLYRAAAELDAASTDPVVRHLADRLRFEARREAARQTGSGKCA